MLCDLGQQCLLGPVCSNTGGKFDNCKLLVSATSQSTLLAKNSFIVMLGVSRFIATPLQKHAYSNIKKISPPKTENFQVKNSDFFHISAQNIDCGYSLELPR